MSQRTAAAASGDGDFAARLAKLRRKFERTDHAHEEKGHVIALIEVVRQKGIREPMHSAIASIWPEALALSDRGWRRLVKGLVPELEESLRELKREIKDLKKKEERRQHMMVWAAACAAVVADGEDTTAEEVEAFNLRMFMAKEDWEAAGKAVKKARKNAKRTRRMAELLAYMRDGNIREPQQVPPGWREWYDFLLGGQ